MSKEWNPYDTESSKSIQREIDSVKLEIANEKCPYNLELHKSHLKKLQILRIQNAGQESRLRYSEFINKQYELNWFERFLNNLFG